MLTHQQTNSYLDNQAQIPVTSCRWRPSESTSKQQNVLLTAGADGQVFHWQVNSGKVLHHFTEQDNSINCVDYNQQGTQFATGGKDAVVRVYDEGTGQCLNVLRGLNPDLPGHSNRIHSVKWNRDEQTQLVSGGWDSTI